MGYMVHHNQGLATMSVASAWQAPDRSLLLEAASALNKHAGVSAAHLLNK
jgi:hypothetical protein